MGNASIMICMIINIVICFGIPIGYLVYAIKVRSGVKAFFIGALVFFVSQILLRLPLIQLVLPNMDWYIKMSNFYPFVYIIFLAITAGLFEEVGRYVGFKLGLKKNRKWSDGIAFGMGHGGIEAMLIVGAINIQKLFMLIALNNGTFDSMKYGMSADAARSFFNSLTTMSVLTAGIERILTIIIQVGFTIIVLYGINKGKKIFVLLAILLHGLVDMNAGLILLGVIGMTVGEIFIFASALGFLIYIIKSKKVFEEMC